MQRLLFLFSFVFYELAGYLSNDMYLPAMLEMSREFSASLDNVQLSIGAWLIGNGSAQVILGPISDHFGKKKVLLYGGVLYLCTLLGCAWSSSIGVFLVLRLIQGMGVASIMIAGYATIHEAYDDQQATRILSWTGTISVLAPMLGPLLGALVLENFSWRMVFVLLSLPTFICLGLLSVAIPQDYRPVRAKSLLESFGQYKALFKNQQFTSLSMAYGCHFACLILWITSSPYLLMKISNLDERTFALSQIPVFVMLGLGANAIRLLEKKFSYKRIIQFGQVVSLIGALSTLLVAVAAYEAKNFVMAILPLTFGFGLLSAPLSRRAMTSTALNQGIVTAGFFLIMDLTGGLGSMIIAIVSDTPVKLSIFFIALSLLGNCLFYAGSGRMPKHR